MLKLGMKPITGVSRVTVKKSKNVGVFSWTFNQSLFHLFTHSNVLIYYGGIALEHRSCLSYQNLMCSRAQHQTHMWSLGRPRSRIWALRSSRRRQSNSRLRISATLFLRVSHRAPQWFKMMRRLTRKVLSQRTLSWWWLKQEYLGQGLWRLSRLQMEILSLRSWSLPPKPKSFLHRCGLTWVMCQRLSKGFGNFWIQCFSWSDFECCISINPISYWFSVWFYIQYPSVGDKSIRWKVRFLLFHNLKVYFSWSWSVKRSQRLIL